MTQDSDPDSENATSASQQVSFFVSQSSSYTPRKSSLTLAKFQNQPTEAKNNIKTDSATIADLAYRQAGCSKALPSGRKATHTRLAAFKSPAHFSPQVSSPLQRHVQITPPLST